MTRYGKLLDFNRKKLRKQRVSLGKQDLLLLVLPGRQEEEGDSESFRNLRGDESPCVLVWLGEPEPERKKQLAELQEKQGFRMLAEFFLEKEMGEAQAGEIALGIRRKLEEL